MSTVYRKYQNCRKIGGTADHQTASIFQKHSKCSVKTLQGKMLLRNKKIDFLGGTITPSRVTPQKEKVVEYTEIIKNPRFKKSITTIHWLFKLRPKLQTTLSRKNPFSQLLKTTENKIIFSPDLMNEIRKIIDVLDKG